MTAAQGTLTDDLDRIADGVTLDDQQIDEIFAVVDAVGDNVSLRRGLADPGREADQRAGLARAVLGGKVSEPVLTVVEQVVRLAWDRPDALLDGLERLGLRQVFRAVEERRESTEVRDELSDFSRVVVANPDLRASLNDTSAASRQARFRLVEDLLANRAKPATVLLAKRASVEGARNYERNVANQLELAAQVRGHEVARVEVAKPLTDDQRARLQRELSRIYGVEVDLTIEVDPHIVGGVRVTVGDEVIDGSIAARLAEASRGLH